MAVIIHLFNTEPQAVDVTDLEKIKRVRRCRLGIVKVIDEPQSSVARLRTFTNRVLLICQASKTLLGNEILKLRRSV
jgi:hypothetical protein